MQKIWKFRDSKTNKLILIKDQSIYKGNINENELNRIHSETKNFSFLNELLNIPYSYIKKIENQNGKNYIKIFFGNDSEEELYIDNENIKNEVFQYLKNDNPKFKYTTKLPSVIKYAKAQFFALSFLSAIFIWSLYLAIQIENGVEYELIGSGGPGLIGIILVIANFGVLKIVIGYLTLLTTTLFSLFIKLKSRSEIETLSR